MDEAPSEKNPQLPTEHPPEDCCLSNLSELAVGYAESSAAGAGCGAAGVAFAAVSSSLAF